MELWIRSQNRSQLVKITGLLLLDKEIRGFTNTEYFYELGIYKTKERALEVLDDIQHKLITLCDSMNRHLYIYEMPKE